MRTRRPTPSPAFPFLCITFAALLAAWAGCSASGSKISSNSTGLGGSGASGPGVGGSLGGAGGTGGSGAVDGGKDGAGGGDAGDSGPACTPDQKICNGMCVAVDDPQYGCGPNSCTSCPAVANGTAACSSGTCALGSCNAGFKNCNGDDSDGCETDTQTDPMQCGACGAPCVLVHATATCTAGICTVGSCDSGGWTDCSGADGGVTGGGDGGTMATIGCGSNTQSDPTNCGTCGNACPGQETCTNGTCSLSSCPKGFANCPGDPVDECPTPLGTNKNCNFCGDSCNLSNSTSQCVPMGGTNVCNLNSCNAGWANCDTIAANGCETNTQTDANNCDSCGNACPFGPHSTAVCNSGGCGLVCDPGYLDCNDNPNDGCEINGNIDVGNCGTCNDVCTTPNATPGCTSGTCTIVTCNSGFQDCDTKVPDGCETNTSADPSNCGTCGTICSTPHATPVCANGTCAIGSCNTGFLDCNGKPTDGCEINGTTDVNNCGTCGDACNVANGTPTCTSGSCAVQSCNPGFQDCDHSPGDGCEVNVNTNPSNCGSCGNACITPNATAACSNGNCNIASCNPGFANCDGAIADGCEINTLTDPNNCGGCGMKCNLPNAVAACTNGMCTVAVCSPGFTNCDGNPTNGCETNTGADSNNCGTCGHVCSVANGSAGCGGGTCTVASCNPGFQDCDHNPTDGCETHTAGDPNNCGGCNVQCNAINGTPGCSNSACTVASCTAPFADCDGIVANGCETNTSTDNNNCGTCGDACLSACGGSGDHVTATHCVASACGVIGCASGYEDYDGHCANGCECLNSTTPTVCTNATSLFAGTLQPGNSITTFSSTMMPTSVTQAYFTLTFGGATNINYHPTITLTSPGNEFLMDVTKDCSNTSFATCNTGGDLANSHGVTSFAISYTGPNPKGDPTNPSFTADWSGQLWIRVYRNPAVTTATCNQYTLNASD